jgi:hypothetical protein
LFFLEYIIFIGFLVFLFYCCCSHFLFL